LVICKNHSYISVCLRNSISYTTWLNSTKLTLRDLH